MPAPTTTADYRTWYQQASQYTTQELINYITPLALSSSEIRALEISFIDRAMSVNGFGIVFDDEDWSGFDAIVVPYESLNGNYVQHVSYFPSLNSVEVQYSCPPLQAKPINTIHTEGDFGTMFASLFDLWHTKILALLNNFEDPTPTF